MAKRRSSKKVVEEVDMHAHCSCSCHHVSMKLAIIAFVLFLMTAWGSLRVALLNVHWGWYLGIMILVLIFPLLCPCRRK